MINQDTICAIATTQGGALGCIRVSGAAAISITASIFTPANKAKRLEESQPYTLTFGNIYDGDELVDEVLVSLFRAPHSYTGEDSTEISCHGSAYILQQIMQLLVKNGCRPAQPGEYTQRAFLNGKMDLSQAEAVADLIASSSAAAHRLAMNQMRGGFSHELAVLRDRLLHFTSLVELELDFSDHEELEFADRSELSLLADEIEGVIRRLTNSFSVGNAIKNGIPVAIIGETNAGKSTLLNALLHEERAIVSDIHGTTRDVIEDTTNIGGTTFRFIDTAGIRDTHDTIETLGIERTFRKIDQAEIVLWLIDATEAEQQYASLSPRLLPLVEHKQLIIVLNKADLLTDHIPTLTDVRTTLPALTDTHTTVPALIDAHTTLPALTDAHTTIAVSAKQGYHLEELQQLLVRAARIPSITASDVIVTNIRHYEALTRAHEAIERVRQGLLANLSGDFLSQDIRECIFHLSDIVGEVTTDMVLQNIFRKFCIGK